MLFRSVLGDLFRRFLADSPFPFQQFLPGGELGILAGLVRLAQFLQQPLQLFAELRFALPGVGGLAAQVVGLELRGLSRPLGLQLGGLPGLVQFQPGGLTLTRKPKVGLLPFRSHGVLHGLFQPRLGKGVVLPAKTDQGAATATANTNSNRFVVTYSDGSQAASVIESAQAYGTNIIDSLPEKDRQALTAAAGKFSVTVESVTAHSLGMAGISLSESLTADQVKEFITKIGRAHV